MPNGRLVAAAGGGDGPTIRLNGQWLASEQRASRAVEETSHLQHELAQRDTCVHELKRHCAGLEEELVQARTLLSAAREEVLVAQKDTAHCRAQHAEAHATVECLLVDMPLYENAHALMIKHYHTLQARWQQAENARALAEVSSKSAATELERVSKLHLQANAQATSLKLKLRDTEDELHDARRRVAEQQRHAHVLQKERERLNDLIKECRRQMAELQRASSRASASYAARRQQRAEMIEAATEEARAFDPQRLAPVTARWTGRALEARPSPPPVATGAPPSEPAAGPQPRPPSTPAKARAPGAGAHAASDAPADRGARIHSASSSDASSPARATDDASRSAAKTHSRAAGGTAAAGAKGAPGARADLAQAGADGDAATEGSPPAHQARGVALLTPEEANRVRMQLFGGGADADADADTAGGGVGPWAATPPPPRSLRARAAALLEPQDDAHVSVPVPGLAAPSRFRNWDLASAEEKERALRSENGELLKALTTQLARCGHLEQQLAATRTENIQLRYTRGTTAERPASARAQPARPRTGRERGAQATRPAPASRPASASAAAGPQARARVSSSTSGPQMGTQPQPPPSASLKERVSQRAQRS